MTSHDEHDDDLEPEVIEGDEIETEKFVPMDDEEESAPLTGVTNSSVAEGKNPTSAKEQEEPEDESTDTI
jgi:hypothetical protein